SASVIASRALTRLSRAVVRSLANGPNGARPLVVLCPNDTPSTWRTQSVFGPLGGIFIVSSDARTGAVWRYNDITSRAGKNQRELSDCRIADSVFARLVNYCSDMKTT